jgi:hypothetical protein
MMAFAFVAVLGVLATLVTVFANTYLVARRWLF